MHFNLFKQVFRSVVSSDFFLIGSYIFSFMQTLQLVQRCEGLLRDIYRKCCESFYCFVNQNPFTFFILAALLWIHSHYALYHYSRLKPLYQYLLIISGLCKVWCMHFVLCMCVYSYKYHIYLQELHDHKRHKFAQKLAKIIATICWII